MAPRNSTFSEALAAPFVFLCAFVLLPSIAFGQTDTWNGGSGNWSNSSKWSSGVPSATSNVFIDNGKAVPSPVTLDINGSANMLTVDSDDSLSFNNGVSLSMGGNVSVIWSQELCNSKAPTSSTMRHKLL